MRARVRTHTHTFLIPARKSVGFVGEHMLFRSCVRVEVAVLGCPS